MDSEPVEAVVRNKASEAVNVNLSFRSSFVHNSMGVLRTCIICQSPTLHVRILPLALQLYLHQAILFHPPKDRPINKDV